MSIITALAIVAEDTKHLQLEHVVGFNPDCNIDSYVLTGVCIASEQGSSDEGELDEDHYSVCFTWLDPTGTQMAHSAEAKFRMEPDMSLSEIVHAYTEAAMSILGEEDAAPVQSDGVGGKDHGNPTLSP